MSNTSSFLASIFQQFVIIVSLCSIAYVLWKWIIYPKHWSPLLSLPQAPGGSYFMGQFFELFGGNPGAPLRKWVDTVPNNGLIRYLDIFNFERVAVVKPEALAEVLVHKCYSFEKPPVLRKGIARILGMGLFLAEGDVHKTQRKNLSPAFAFRHLKDLYPAFWAKSVELVAAVTAAAELSEESTVEVNSWASRATLDIIGVAGMGYDFRAIADPNGELLTVYRSIFSPSRVGQLLGILSAIFPGWVVRALPIRRNQDINHSSTIIRKHCASLIALKKERLQKSSSRGSPDIIEVALTSGCFTDEELVDQLMTFLAAGHETTASALTWTIYLLASHPKVQETLRAEIRAAVPDGQCEITAATIDGMKYLQAVCNETLRLFPPVSLTVRVAVQDTIIVGQRIPKGTAITLPPWAVNASIELWGPNAAEFMPERWLESEKGGSTSNFSFMTFLHGPRTCIGERFTRGELACLVVAWVRAFDTRLLEEGFVPEVRGGITMKPAGGLHVRLRRLDRSHDSSEVMGIVS